MGIGTHQEEVDAAATTMGCSIFTTPFVHLGVKVGGAMCGIKSWDDVVDTVSHRLSKWKLKTLSIGGRLTLIKSVLTSVLLYMSIFKVLSGVLKLLESIRRNFLNGVDGSERKMAWISWNKLDDMALKHKFPRLYASDNYKQITLVKKINHVSMVDTFRRPPRGGAEEEQLGFLLSYMDGLILTNIPDRWIWSLEATSEFSIKSVCQLLDDLIHSKEKVATRSVDSFLKYYESTETRPIFSNVEDMVQWAGLYDLTTKMLEDE
nr:RNA-directed DNA polymerase, eukaryota [Tanacetum cinerariifolium]